MIYVDLIIVPVLGANLFRISGFEESGPGRVDPVHNAQLGDLLGSIEVRVHRVHVLLLPALDICISGYALRFQLCAVYDIN